MERNDNLPRGQQERFFLPHFIDASGAEAINGRQQLHIVG
jgi:hypothetical protein